MNLAQIYDIIENDLSGYSQSNPSPDSLTIKDSNGFRHYELGSVYGVVCFNEDHVFFCDIKEDDGNWFCFNGTDKDYSDAAWIKTKIAIYQRMQKWLDVNLNRSYYSGFEGKEGFECGYKDLK